MPYTPPSQQSPASSKFSSPVPTRTSSYSEDDSRPPVIGRPTPPRSNSASYLHRHRRSPSIKSDGALPTPSGSPDHAVEATDFASNGSIHQQPPPGSVNGSSGGPSPPDSSENSESDENVERGRALGNGVEDELRQSVRGINQKRESSPENKPGVAHTGTSSEPTSQSSSPTSLTKEARKISHSRSSTEMYIPARHRTSFGPPSHESDDSDEESLTMSKPSLVRKKSGELVKPALRPSSRRRYSSMPGTPTYGKTVHFNENENQTRHFLQVDKPIAVSAGTSPVETYDSDVEYPFEGEREMKLSNFPADTIERKIKPIRVERIFLSSDRNTLIGVCAVHNISFHKVVIARFTLDYWKTTSEVVAEYNNDPKNQPTDGCDRFNFHIKLTDQANIDDKTLLLCVRYSVNGQDFWDNNEGSNYQIDFKLSKKPPKPAPATGLGARPLNAIPRSRHSPPATSRGHRESLDDDFAARFDRDSAYTLTTPDNLLGDPSSSIKLKPRTKRGSLFPNDTNAPPSNGLGGRYDFGASLSAALTQAQEKLGNKSGLMNDGIKPGPSPSGGSYFGPIERKEGPAKTDERPDAITTDRPAMGSEQYKDLVQKFCYFTSGAGKQAPSPPHPSVKSSSDSQSVSNTDGTADDSTTTSSSTSGTASPVHTSNEETSSTLSPSRSLFGSRSTSPSPVTGGAYSGRSDSPISFGYPYHHISHDGYFPETPAPTAIQG